MIIGDKIKALNDLQEQVAAIRPALVAAINVADAALMAADDERARVTTGIAAACGQENTHARVTTVEMGSNLLALLELAAKDLVKVGDTATGAAHSIRCASKNMRPCDDVRLALQRTG